MSATALSLMRLDVLPGRCAIETQVAKLPDAGMAVRFRAERPRWFRRRETSQWSDWFTYEGEAIELAWATFWIGEQ